MSGEFLQKSEDKHLTDLEIRNLITNLSPADTLRLIKIAKRNIWGCQMEAEDLLQEAIVATISGNRKFPRNVRLIAFFAFTMKSIASNEREKRKKMPEIINTDDEQYNNHTDNIAANNIDFDIENAANKDLKAIYDLFENDDDVASLLMEKEEGKTPDEICETLGWNRTTYNSVQKRLRRSLNKHFPNGRKT